MKRLVEPAEWNAIVQRHLVTIGAEQYVDLDGVLAELAAPSGPPPPVPVSVLLTDQLRSDVERQHRMQAIVEQGFDLNGDYQPARGEPGYVQPLAERQRAADEERRRELAESDARQQRLNAGAEGPGGAIEDLANALPPDPGEERRIRLAHDSNAAGQE